MRAAKQVAARAAAQLVLSRDYETIGVGTGSTVGFFVEELASRPEAAKLRYVASSIDTARKLSSRGLLVLDPGTMGVIDVYVDGADEVDPKGNMIKGRGAAHLSEKMLAYRSRFNIFIVDESKLVNRLGEKRPVPVSVVPSALSLAVNALSGLGYNVEPRRGGCKDGPCIDDHGFVVIDVHTGPMKDPESVERLIRSIPGVVETGLFLGLTDLVVIGRTDGSVQEVRARRTRGLHL